VTTAAAKGDRANAGDRSVTLTIPPDLARLAEIRQMVVDIAGALPLSRGRTYDLKLAASEACANAIEHGTGPGPIEIVARVLSDRLIVQVTNSGVFRPVLSKDTESQRRGLGLPLMVSLADDVLVSQLPDDRTQISLTFFLHRHRDRQAVGSASPA
jgi:anti-sigma regulatory factor (Ser/Thr protein kinase)